MADRGVSPIGAKSMLGIALQPDAETAVAARHLVEYRTGALEGEQNLLFSEANIDSPSPRNKVVVGDFQAGGDFNAEVTPKRAMPTIFTALFGAPTETILSPDTPIAPSAVVNGLGANTVRKYYIVARNAQGYPSLPSLGVTVLDTNDTLTAQNSVSLTWTAVPGATSYDVLRSDGSGSTIANAKKIARVNTNAAVDTGVGGGVNGEGVEYRVLSSPVSQKEWKHNWNRRWVTFVQKKGDAIFAFPFCAVHGMNVRVDRGQREAITSQISSKAGNMWTLCDAASSSNARTAAMAEAGLDTALYDDLPPFSPARAIVKISEVGGELTAASHMKGFSLNFDRNTADEYCLNGKLGPFGFTDGISGLDVNLDAYFKSGSERDLKRFMGHASTVSSESKYGFTGNVREVSTSCVFPYPSGYGYDSVMEFIMPRSAYGSVGQAVGGRGEALMQAIRIEPLYDGNEDTDLIVRLISNETAASILLDNGQPIVPPPDDMIQAIPVVPAQVTNFAAANGVGQSVMTWNAMPNAVGYRIEKSTAANGQPWTPVAQSRTAGYTATNLAAGTIHFRVSAYNGGGYGPVSVTGSAVIS